MLFEYEAGIFKCPQSVLDEAMATIKPLSVPSPDVLAASSSAPAAPSKRYLEELRSRGASALRVLGRYAREEGNKHFKRGEAMKDGELIPIFDRRAEPAPLVKPGVEHVVDRTFCYGAARADYADAARVPEESAVTLCNLAAVLLKQKE